MFGFEHRYELFVSELVWRPTRGRERLSSAADHAEPVGHLVISDVKMPGSSGVDLLRELHSKYRETTVILVTAFGTVERAVEAMKAGARHYFTRPVDIRELRMVVEHALEHIDVQTEVRLLRSALDQECEFEKMLGHSHTMLQVLDQAARVAPTSSSVLIQGETGTGKEPLARAIHANSSRRAKPFITVNCGAIPRDLLESELFGHVRGSFTGALMDRKGKPKRPTGYSVSRRDWRDAC
jgi:DNA-binding NtrC family response regulator